MKRWTLLITLMCLLGTLFHAAAEDTPAEPTARYTAITLSAVQPRTAVSGGKKLRQIRADARVDVLEYSDDWCLIRYRDRSGYVRTKYLWGFVSLDPSAYPSPQFTPCRGYVTLTSELLVKGGKFSGLTASPGTLLAVYDESGSLPVWRGSGIVDTAVHPYTAFADWQTAGPGDFIAGFTTYYGPKTGTPLHKERQHNIRLGCERIDGQTVAAGAEFSFNALCAPYKKDNDYKVAKNISKVGKGPGGGVCQVSTTLYNAILSLPLTVTAWAAHRPSGVNYIPRSFDAAVGSTTDLAFRNDLPYAIRIKALPQDGALTILIVRAE